MTDSELKTVREIRASLYAIMKELGLANHYRDWDRVARSKESIRKPIRELRDLAQGATVRRKL